MVVRGLLVFWLCFSVFLQAQDVKVTAEIDSDNAFENKPIPGTIMITHDVNEKVDPNSFVFDKNTPLKVDYVKDVVLSPSSPLVISLYRFTIPPREKGLHVLPHIQVKVGETIYQSALSSFEVHSGSASSFSKPIPVATPPVTKPTPAKPTPQTAVKPVLKLEAFVQGKSTLFPGERTLLVYRYSFNTDIELKKEELPMLDAIGLRKIGSKQVKDRNEGDLSIREIIQEVEGVNPGSFTFGPSVIEGYATVFPGARQLLKANAPAVTLQVNPLPAETKPSSFNGMIGDFVFKVTMLTPNSVQVGDKIKLNIEATGKGDLSTVKLPELCCQPGLEGLFSQSDLVDAGQIQGGRVMFNIDMRPLSALINEFPSFEYSMFNPETKKYIVRRTNAIPLTVKNREVSLPPTPKTEKQPEKPAENVWNERQAVQLRPIEIQGNETLTPTSLKNKMFGTWWSLLLIPLGAVLFVFLQNLKKYQEQIKAAPKTRTSLSILEEAKQANQPTDHRLSLLIQALLLRLEETGKIPMAAGVIPENLPKEGVAGEVRNFILKIEKDRFAGGKVEAIDDYLTKGTSLYSKIGQ